MVTYRIHFVGADNEDYTYYGQWKSEEEACVATWVECKAIFIQKVEIIQEDVK